MEYGHEVTNLLLNIGDSEMKTRTIIFISALLALRLHGHKALWLCDLGEDAAGLGQDVQGDGGGERLVLAFHP